MNGWMVQLEQGIKKVDFYEDLLRLDYPFYT